MKKLFIVVLLIVGLLIPAVSGEILYDEEIKDYKFTGASYEVVGNSPNSGAQANPMVGLTFPDITKCNDISYIVVEGIYDIAPGSDITEGENVVEYWFTDDTENRKTAIIHIDHIRNIVGTITSTKATIFLDDWDIGDRVGTKEIEFSTPILSGSSRHSDTRPPDMPVYVKSPLFYFPSHKVVISCGQYTQNHITISSTDYDYTIELQRIISGIAYKSDFIAYNDSEEVYVDASADDKTYYFLRSQIDEIKLITSSETHVYSLIAEESPDTSPIVNIYVRNSQNNALISNSHIVINASVNDTFYEVVNESLPGGIYTGNLHPTGGGISNPDFYQLIATAEGYNSVMPYIDFEVDESTTIYVYMEPVGGAPEDENNTFIDFYVRDLAANPISGATVNFGGYTLITNSAGYTIFEVDKNKTYSWVVSKSGYGSVTGNAVIGGNTRYTINAVIAPAVTPTTPTPIPSLTPVSPTPTMTAPTGEPVSNWLEWFAAHFGMILGGGVEIGKIFMWLCFTVPVGVYVGKEAKAGAAGFMAGAGIVTLFFVLIGWVPIWLVVLLVLIIGLLYAKVFNNSDNGGGR